MAAAREALLKRIYEDPRHGFGSIADTLKQARRQDPTITRADVSRFMEGVKAREDRPQRGYNSFVPTEPLHQLQVDLADMSVFSSTPIWQVVRPRRSAQRLKLLTETQQLQRKSHGALK